MIEIVKQKIKPTVSAEDIAALVLKGEPVPAQGEMLFDLELKVRGNLADIKTVMAVVHPQQ